MFCRLTALAKKAKTSLRGSGTHGFLEIWGSYHLLREYGRSLERCLSAAIPLIRCRDKSITQAVDPPTRRYCLAWQAQCPTKPSNTGGIAHSHLSGALLGQSPPPPRCLTDVSHTRRHRQEALKTMTLLLVEHVEKIRVDLQEMGASR